ncbi:sensor domain-containing diguanylate cyclase [Nocardia huaxiensis]|uniref:GGDEF domain-containing protein n=1 Tax=Nocardia huaxiensis TaxID=2755382 RepID=A0A7D6VMA0_9NOCA|nr:GGDEF domain-containing protein [Nocardia huaxiensis]QLY32976.1 GGDEF domain-containing protein [Nocardia huaxiensis]UFS93263.1 GGDEF domain-containing protein [Nocardia huaxiensis]
MADSRSMFRAWLRDRVDYRWLVRTFESHGALGRFKFMLGAGGIVMLVIALLAMVAQHELAGPAGIAQGLAEAAVAGIWTWRWWFLRWPGERESLAWIALFDLDALGNTLVVHDPVIGVLGLMLLAAMGAYVTVFHSPRVLAVHVLWSLLASVVLSVRMFSAAVGLSVVLVMLVVIGVMLPFMQFSHWLLRRDALSDPLTRLLNRRGLDSYLLSHTDSRKRDAAYVATLDLDRFKAVNDTYGHSLGDKVLTGVARILSCTADSDALVARTGGEEFVIVGYLRDEAVITGERLRRAVETLPGLPVPITTSVGIAVFDATQWDEPCGEAAYHDLFRRSDSAMYQAKRLGGNTVVVDADGRAELSRPVSPGSGSC